MPTRLNTNLTNLENNNFNPNESSNAVPQTIPQQPGGQASTPPPQFDGNVPAQSFGYTSPNVNVQTPTAPSAGQMQTRLDTALQERQASSQNLEGKQGVLESRIQELAGATMGRGAEIKKRQQEAGIGKVQDELNDLLGLVSQKTNAYEQSAIRDQEALASLEGTGMGIPQSIVRGRQARLQTQQQLKRQSDAVELNALNRTSELMQGRITTAQQNIKDDVELEFGDKERALNMEMKFLERVDTKLSSAKAEKLQFEIQQVQQERQDRENVMNLAVNLAKNGAPQSVVLAANKAKDVIELLSIPGSDKFLLSQEERMNLAIKGQALADARAAASGASGDNPKVVAKMQADPEFAKLKGQSDLKYALKNYKEAVDASGGAKRKGRAAAQPIESAYSEVLQAYRAAKDLKALQAFDLDLINNAIKEATYGKGSQFTTPLPIPGFGQIQKGRATKAAYSSIDAATTGLDENIARQQQLVSTINPDYASTTYYKTLVDPSLLGTVDTDITTAGDSQVFGTASSAYAENIDNNTYASGLQ